MKKKNIEKLLEVLIDKEILEDNGICKSGSSLTKELVGIKKGYIITELVKRKFIKPENVDKVPMWGVKEGKFFISNPLTGKSARLLIIDDLKDTDIDLKFNSIPSPILPEDIPEDNETNGITYLPLMKFSFLKDLPRLAKGELADKGVCFAQGDGYIVQWGKISHKAFKPRFKKMSLHTPISVSDDSFIYLIGEMGESLHRGTCSNIIGDSIVTINLPLFEFWGSKFDSYWIVVGKEKKETSREFGEEL